MVEYFIYLFYTLAAWCVANLILWLCAKYIRKQYETVKKRTTMTQFFDIYLKVKPEQYKNNVVLLFHDSGDILPLTDNINTFVLYYSPDFLIVVLRLTQENMESFLYNVPTGINPFSYEGAEAMGLKNCYIGHTFEEVETAFPELVKPKQIEDTDGNVYVVTDIMKVVVL